MATHAKKQTTRTGTAQGTARLLFCAISEEPSWCLLKRGKATVLLPLLGLTEGLPAAIRHPGESPHRHQARVTGDKLSQVVAQLFPSPSIIKEILCLSPLLHECVPSHYLSARGGCLWDVAEDLPWEVSQERLLLKRNVQRSPPRIYKVWILIFYGSSLRIESIKWVQGLI